MTVRLLYHDAGSPGAVSPFDEAIVSIAKGDHVRLACPYIGLAYLTRITSITKSWRLLTDVEEWQLSQNRRQREKIYQFLVRNHSLVRHYPSLHAKVVIGSRSVMFGSANFTEMGITRRTELSALLEDEAQVQELTAWFETHWSRAYELPLDDIAAYMKTLPEGAVIEDASNPVLFPTLPTKSARLVHISGGPTEIEGTPEESADHQRLIQRVGIAFSRPWFEGYLDLVRLLIEELALESSDPRLAMSIPKGGNGCFLPVSINNRYVVTPDSRNGEDLIGVIFGSDFERRPTLRAKVVRYGRFEALPGEKPEDVPFFLRVRSVDDIMQDEELKLGWLDAARCELDRARASPYRRFHVPVCYRLAVDSTYRHRVLDKSFGSDPPC